MGLDDLFHLSNLILSFHHLFEQSSLFQPVLNDASKVLVEFTDGTKNIVLDDVHQAVELA